MNFRMMTRSGSLRKTFQVAMIAAACILAASPLRAQNAAPGSATGSKIGVINVRQAIASTAEGKQAGAELQSQFSARQSELEGLNKQINDLRQRMEAGSKLSPEEQARLQREGETRARQLQRKQDEYQEDVNAAQADVFDRIGRKMIDVLDRYARENGYVAILDSSAQNTPILFASTNIDVTQDIVKLYDQAYPVKGGAPASTAPATRPAQKPAAQPPAAKPPQR
ncbi:MAG TPA: OmpH family outer membrane protein [Candidatus Acidoferrum sp.]|nr:OmpH family outer membrane protein [Candidatus Acidoferrum sp.]